MISSLQGGLESQGPNEVVINVGPMSLQVHAPTSTLSVLGRVGEQVKLYTYLYLKEDNLSLYGFATTEERDLFQTIIGVGGVGPKLALALLSAMSPERLAAAIASGDTEQLTQVSGLGKKMAGRLVLELNGKLEREWGEVVGPILGDQEEVVSALTALGYAASEARAAISQVHLDSDASLEEKVRLVLQNIGSG
ncbi:MAG: Holliday junction branch migration protein RuvA [Dehalococcoidia bacterium]